MRILLVGFFYLGFLGISYSQTTTHCLEIENILVDACGNPEGQNEMVRILVGPNPLTLSNISISWPNNSFNGFIQNPTTAMHTNTLNSTIQGCGWLKEPTNGILPANSKAIIVTSYLMNPSYNSFAGLTDTMYILFQNSTVTSGHFANYSSGSGLRTTTITYGGCVESATYNKANMIYQDGAGVSFSQSGTPTYYSGGCNAPVSNLIVDAQIVGNPTSFCEGSSLNIQATWSGGNGTFVGWTENGNGSLSNPNSANTTYNSVVPEVSTLKFIAHVKISCGDTIKDTVSISLMTPQPFQITPGTSPTTLCPGQSLTLSVPSGTYTNGPIWSTFATGNSITVTGPGTYIAGATDQCYTYADTVVVTAGIAPAVTVNPSTSALCAGQTITLTASGVLGSLSWNTGATTPSITVSTIGNYTATATNACGTATSTATITTATAPNFTINAPSSVVCPGSTLPLSVSGANSPIIWNTGQTGNSIQINTPGTYTATSTNACGTHTDSIVITAGIIPNIQIEPHLDTLCSGDSMTLNAYNIEGALLWNTGSTSNSITINNGGTYSVTATNACGTASDQASIISLDIPTIQITSNSSLISCENSSIVLTANTTNSSNIEWGHGPNTQNVTIDSPGNYTATASNYCGSASAQVTVSPGIQPYAQINPLGDTDFCKGESLLLEAVGNGNFLWSNNQTGTQISVTQSGMYTLIVSNECGSDTAKIQINANGPNADFSFSGGTSAPTSISYINNSTGATSYIWNLANQTTSSAFEPTQFFNTGGVFDITLMATDDNGCQDSISKILVLEDPLNFYMPNSFTPNGDNINDNLLVIATGVSSFNMLVYNRWGELIFESTDMYQGWDGKTNSGNPVIQGIYTVVVEYKVASTGKEERKITQVTLIK